MTGLELSGIIVCAVILVIIMVLVIFIGIEMMCAPVLIEKDGEYHFVFPNREWHVMMCPYCGSAIIGRKKKCPSCGKEVKRYEN